MTKHKHFSILFGILFLFTYCVQDTFLPDLNNHGNPSDLSYMEIKNARESSTIISGIPTVSTNGLIPFFEVIEGYDQNDNLLDESYMQYVSIANPDTTYWSLGDQEYYPVDEKGDTVKGGVNINLSNAGVITISEGNKFTVGDYYFTIKVTTKYKDKTFSTVFNKAFHLNVEPLLPQYLIYQLKHQNLIYGDANSKSNKPIIPLGNKDVRFSLKDNTDKLIIDDATGEVSLHPNYAYNGFDTIQPVINVTSNISNETVSFSNSLVVIVTDVETIMPIESIYFFYPTLKTTGAKPTGGEGFSVQVVESGSCQRIWGVQTNSTGGALIPPPERPEGNGSQKPLETVTHGAANPAPQTTTPSTSWCVLSTTDLTTYKDGYDIFIGFYYRSYFVDYMDDGRTPTELEVYISTDYNGGLIQNSDGSWTNNGTWSKINDQITCQIGIGQDANGNPTGESWGKPFIGTPYPGNQKGLDPDGKKNASISSDYGQWIKCSYDITNYKTCKTFTVAFRVESFFSGKIMRNETPGGRGGSHFLTDFYFVANEVKPN